MLGVCSVHSSYFAIITTYSGQVLRHFLHSSHYPCPRYYHYVSPTSPAFVVVVLVSPPAMGRRENMAGNKLAIS
jgi:hypothetical protein